MPTKNHLSARLLNLEDDLHHVFCALKAFNHALQSIYENGVDQDTASGFDWLGQCVLDQVEQLERQLEHSHTSLETALRASLSDDQADEVLKDFIAWSNSLEKNGKKLKGVSA
jgi:hypothetical protein